MVNGYPTISIVTPTYNSGRTLEMCLVAIRKQSYPGKIEVLIVDGGSSDNTIEIAQKYNCRILKNPKTHILEAEEIGFNLAKGKYLVGLAPDEVLENKNSLLLKYTAFSENKKVRAVLLSGYKTPVGYHEINNYINEFGDPFSYFMYRDSKGYGYLLRDFDKKYKRLSRNKNYSVYDLSNVHPIPLIELWAGGCMIDLEYAKKHFPEIKSNPSLIPLVFYLFVDEEGLLAITHNDPTRHYSSATFGKYLKKIRSRVEYNTFLTSMGKGGYSGREKFERPSLRFKKYLFIFYSFSIVVPFIDSIFLSFSRKKTIYLTHTFLCMYTSLLIIYFFLLKKLGVKHYIKLYGN